jgi:hypothetical protein
MRFPRATRKLDPSSIEHREGVGAPLVGALSETPTGLPLPDEPEKDTANSLAEAILATGMAGPAALALHIARPLSWIGGQMAWVAAPLVEALGIGMRRNALSTGNIARFLEKEENLTSLQEQLERASHSGRARPR